MREYSIDKLNVAAVVSELDTLFQFHPHLLNEYRIFLSPPTLPSPQQSPNMKILKPCVAFMNQVLTRFANERGVVVAYLEIIRALAQGKICKDEAYNAIEKIFGEENRDLVDGFEWIVLGCKGIRKEEKKKNSREAKEDDMFEIDLKLHLRKTTAESANKLMESLEKKTASNNQYQRISQCCESRLH